MKIAFEKSLYALAAIAKYVEFNREIKTVGRIYFILECSRITRFPLFWAGLKEYPLINLQSIIELALPIMILVS